MGTAAQIKTSQDKVAHILEMLPDSRDCDKLLWMHFLADFCGLIDVIGFEAYKKLNHFIQSENIPSMDALSRVRRKYQQQGRFLGVSHKEEEAKVRDLFRKNA